MQLPATTYDIILIKHVWQYTDKYTDKDSNNEFLLGEVLIII